MSRPSYAEWLLSENQSTAFALVVAYEKRDYALYVEAPALRQTYMEKIGYFEERVLQSEMEAVMLEHKARMVQAAVNRRETPDMGDIARRLDALRQELIQKEEEKDASLAPPPQLSPDEAKEMQRLYREIIAAFHPAMHPALTQTQKLLYEKALDAYKRQNIAALRLISGMLADRSAGVDIDVSVSTEAPDANETATEAALALGVDYTLAKQLYACFAPMEADQVLIAARVRNAIQLDAVDEEMARVRDSFPFSAQETLRDPARVEEYLSDLRARLRQSERAAHDLNARIERLLREVGA